MPMGWRDERTGRVRGFQSDEQRANFMAAARGSARARPSDAAMLGAEPLGRALQGSQDARQVDLLPPQRKCCGQTGAAGSRAPFRRPGPHPARRDASRTQPAARSLAPRSARARQDDYAGHRRRGDLPSMGSAARLPARCPRSRPSGDRRCVPMDLGADVARSDQRRRAHRQACATAQPDCGGKPCIRSFGITVAGSFRWCGRNSGRRLR